MAFRDKTHFVIGPRATLYTVMLSCNKNKAVLKDFIKKSLKELRIRTKDFSMIPVPPEYVIAHNFFSDYSEDGGSKILRKVRNCYQYTYHTPEQCSLRQYCCQILKARSKFVTLLRTY